MSTKAVLAIVALWLLALLLLGWVLWRDYEARTALHAERAANVAALRVEAEQARAVRVESQAARAEATAAREAAETSAAQARDAARQRIRVVRVRERELVAQPPTQAGAAESMARAQGFRRRLDVLVESQP